MRKAGESEQNEVVVVAAPCPLRTYQVWVANKMLNLNELARGLQTSFTHLEHASQSCTIAVDAVAPPVEEGQREKQNQLGPANSTMMINRAYVIRSTSGTINLPTL